MALSQCFQGKGERFKRAYRVEITRTFRLFFTSQLVIYSISISSMKNIFTKIAATAVTMLAFSGAIAVDALAATMKPTPLIFDDDGSQDGMTALAYMLANPEFDIEAITIAQGIARPEVFVNNIERMLGRLNVTGIPLGIGRPDPLAGNNVFPEFVRDGSDSFWAPFVTLPDSAPPAEKRSAAELIVETVKNSPEPVAILATGPLTNIAEALRLDPTIIDNISVV